MMNIKTGNHNVFMKDYCALRGGVDLVKAPFVQENLRDYRGDKRARAQASMQQP